MKIALSAPADLHALAQFSGQQCEGIAPGLGSTATTPLICELVRRGHDVTLYTLSKGLTQGCQYRWNNLRVVVGPFRERHLAATYFRPEIDFLRRAIEADAPPLVHAHWTYEFALGALRSGAPTLTTIHDLPWNVLRHYRDPHRAVRLAMAYEVALRGKYFSAVSEAAAYHFASFFRFGTEIPVVTNGITDEVLALGRATRPGRSRAITFATILQGWSRRKNAQTALKAFCVVRHEIPQARLLMFGFDYQLNGPAHQWAAAHGFERDVAFVGPVKHDQLLPRIAEQVDAVVHPSRDEAFSMAALEAMALRKPLIAGETTPGMREMLGPGGGLLVDVRSSSAIAQAMIQIAVNANYRHHLANHCFERVVRLYRLGTSVDQYEALYTRIVRSDAVRASFRPPTPTNIPLDI